MGKTYKEEYWREDNYDRKLARKKTAAVRNGRKTKQGKRLHNMVNYASIDDLMSEDYYDDEQY